ncbi:MAG: DUF1194 domain-containing protein [Pseudomonadota bacterium]
MRPERPSLAALALAGLLAASPAAATPCRLALVLAIDVSASVDAAEYDLLRSGTAAALASPEVEAAILSLGGVHIAAFQWSGRGKERVSLPWTPLDGPAAIAAAAGLIAGTPRSTANYPTSLGWALGVAQRLHRDGPAPCDRRVVDVSGDGPNNYGFDPASAYRAFDFAGITVNGLVVAEQDSSDAAPTIDYYRDNVLRGPGAFLEIALGYADFERAMRRKLLREIGVLSLSRASQPR